MALTVLPLLLSVSAAQAQRLLTLVPGVSQAASVGDPGSMGPAPVAVDVDLDLLRNDPWRLEAPTPDGSVLVAERSVFEDRGGGDLMWSGGQPGAGYDTVVLTVEGGRFVGRFGAAGGGAYQIHAERDGSGGMAPIVGARPEGWCGVDSAEEGAHDGHAHVREGALAADPPRRVSNPQSHDRLDILVAYTATAARNWADRGGPEAAIRHAGDYMKMVFRNSDLGVEPHIVHITQAPAALELRLGERGWWQDGGLRNALMHTDGKLLRLRHEHRADFVHFFAGEPGMILGFCGIHSLLTRGDTAESFFQGAYGWTSNGGGCRDYAAIFVHEIGHGLGANHEPAATRRPPEDRFRPYAAGYVNFETVPAIGTAMTYRGQTEPFFSTTRFDLHGATVGVRDEQNNERTLRESVHLGVRYSDYLPLLEDLPAQPTGLRAWFDGGAAHLAWPDDAPEADGYELQYQVPLVRASDRRFDCCIGASLRVQGRAGATVPLEHTEPGTRYYFRLRALKGEARSLPGSWVPLVVPGVALEAPSDVSVTFDRGLVHVHWSDNSDDEAGIDVQLVRNGEPVRWERLPPDSEHTSFSEWTVSFGVPPPALEGTGDYGVRVLAFSSFGQARGSEEASFRWGYPNGPPPVSDVAVSAIGPTTARVTWTVDPNVRKYSVDAEVPGGNISNDWHPPDDGAVETGWLDIDGLARGGRYTFNVESVRQGRSLPSKAYLTMGERGRGPQAPSELSGSEIRRNGNKIQVRLSWEDNSTDELGFVVQEASPGSEYWFRREVGWHAGLPILLVPANTTSAEVHGNFDDVFRVFAFNERGYSLSSPRLDKRPEIDLAATAGDTMVGLNWGVEFRWAMGGDVTVTGMQVRWRATAGPPFDGSGATWVNLPAWARGHTVTGLRNGTEYTFAVRAVTKEGVGLTWTGTATPRRGLPPPRQPAGSCRSDAQTLCLRDSRFEAKAYWRSADGGSGAARVVNEGTDESGIFEFFGPENWEILLKVLDGCETNGKVWVLGASTTNLGYRIEVTDTVTGESKRYENEPSQPAPAIIDTAAFSRSCGGSAGGR